jgi:hypothetical protein
MLSRLETPVVLSGTQNMGFKFSWKKMEERNMHMRCYM